MTGETYADQMARQSVEAMEAQKASAATPDREREALRVAVGSVLFNASNFPERVQTRLLGQNMAPLNEKITDAVLEALALTEVPDPSGHHVDHQDDEPEPARGGVVGHALAEETIIERLGSLSSTAIRRILDAGATTIEERAADGVTE